MLSGDVQRSGLAAPSKTEPPPSLAAVMVHVDLEREVTQEHEKRRHVPQSLLRWRVAFMLADFDEQNPFRLLQ